MSDPLSIRVYITPLASRNSFLDEVEVTDDCDLSGAIVKAGIDKEPYDIGTFLYDDLTLTFDNQEGNYSNENDSRSIFKYLRDGAKVRIVFHDSDATETDIFKGFTDELGSFDDPVNDIVKIKVLSLDSIIRKLGVNAGSISAGMTFTESILAILDRTEITSVLSFDPGDIELGLDLEVDDGSWFDGKDSREALNALLIASGSVLVVDIATESLSIRPRTENAVSVFPLYGPDSQIGTQNVIGVTAWNSGYGRMFNSISVGGYNFTDLGLTDKYLGRLKVFDLGFMTDETKCLSIAENLVDIFGTPKPETKMEVTLSLGLDIDMFDPVTIDWPLRATPAPGETHVPLYAQAVFGTDKYPMVRGSYKETPNIEHKLIGFEMKLESFTTVLRLSRTN